MVTFTRTVSYFCLDQSTAGVHILSTGRREAIGQFANVCKVITVNDLQVVRGLGWAGESLNGNFNRYFSIVAGI